MKIAFYEIKGWEKPLIARALKGHALSFFHEPLAKDNIRTAKQFDIISVFIYSKIGPVVVSSLPKLKLIVTRSTGYDHINIKACKKKKIAVANIPFYGENTVAEHTFALILSLSRNVHKSYLRTLRNDFTIEGLKGFDLYGKTIGVVGAGRIGLHVIRIAKGFGMEAIAFDVNQDKFLSDVLGFNYVSMDELLASSDIITLHLPYNSHTHHLINKQSIKKIKKGAILINTARGGIVDSDALIEALDKNILSGVGLDVMEGEEFIKEERQILYDEQKTAELASLVKEHILLGKDNVVYTPHIGFYSEEALNRIFEKTVENIQSFIDKKAKNIVV